MLFLNIQTEEFGIIETDVRARLAHVSLPMNLARADLSDFGFIGYEETLPPEPSWNTMAIEIEPVAGVQQWELVSNGLRTPPMPARRTIGKSIVSGRVMDAGKITEVHNFLLANPPFHAQWFSPDWPNVFCDDPGLLYVLNAVGCTEHEIMVITTP